MTENDKNGVSVLDQIQALYESPAGNRRYDEAVTQREHALQCAQLAEQAGAPASLIIAALLHDIGHLLANLDEPAARHGVDDRHEKSGARWLARWFGPAVTEPLRLHVDAKRYLCADTGAGADNNDYYETLSPASKRSLALQGGPFTADEAAVFAAEPYGAAATDLRRWDDAAKVPGHPTPAFQYYMDIAEAVLER